MKLTIVIPALNEELGIGPTLDNIPTDQLLAAGYSVEILVVDNGSTDRTATIARDHGARVVSQSKRGYGNAYQAGFAAATGDIIVSGDADMTYPFDTLPAILAKMKQDNLDFITTDRLSLLDSSAMHLSHVVGNYILSFVTHSLFRVSFKDSQSGMWIFKRSIWPELSTTHPGMPFSQEIKIDAYTKGFRCAEVPIQYRQRLGEKKLSVLDAWRTLSELFKKRIALGKRQTQTLDPNLNQTPVLRSLPQDYRVTIQQREDAYYRADEV